MLKDLSSFAVLQRVFELDSDVFIAFTFFDKWSSDFLTVSSSLTYLAFLSKMLSATGLRKADSTVTLTSSRLFYSTLTFLNLT